MAFWFGHQIWVGGKTGVDIPVPVFKHTNTFRTDCSSRDNCTNNQSSRRALQIALRPSTEQSCISATSSRVGRRLSPSR